MSVYVTDCCKKIKSEDSIQSSLSVTLFLIFVARHNACWHVIATLKTELRIPGINWSTGEPDCGEESEISSRGGGGGSESTDRRGGAILALELVPKNLIFA